MTSNSKTRLDLPELTRSACDIAANAAEKILLIYNTDFSIDRKDDRSPLTNADMASHDAICSQLAELTPEYPVLSEESAHVPYSERKTWETYWLVDPLDGTREFIKQNGEFTVNIALIHRQKPVLGVVNVPVADTTYYAFAGHGTIKKVDGREEELIHVRRTDPAHICIAGSRSHGNETLRAFVNNIENCDLLSVGSSLKFCLIAEGRADIYPRFGPTSEWDTAAAQCLVEEAGGIVTDTSLRPLRYNSKETLLNPHFLVIGDREFDWRPYLPDE